uniref:Uncharacterized protein n=1 Tax=Oryza punctata TaxID=4537 RepID=A0A0E0MA78_ORYPU
MAVSITREGQILAVEEASSPADVARPTTLSSSPRPGIKGRSPPTSVSSPLGRQGIRLRSLCRSPRLSLPPLLLRSRLKRLQDKF